ncbi:hypothetical protein M405DRAFT_867086 [Rhizopogon salebrosus TDB-379]|nr:hypothetical protein M405DRAFT_867086 [Rhizopogon salebrosus TDB-379]
MLRFFRPRPAACGLRFKHPTYPSIHNCCPVLPSQFLGKLPDFDRDSHSLNFLRDTALPIPDMATFHGSLAPSHFGMPRVFPTPWAYHPSAPPPKPQSTQPSSTRHSDPFYGHKKPSCLYARFITYLIACPKHPSSSSTLNCISLSPPSPPRPPSTSEGLLPYARGCDRLFVFAFMLASKVIYDDTCLNKYIGSIITQGMFQLREINQMDREMCQYISSRSSISDFVTDSRTNTAVFPPLYPIYTYMPSPTHLRMPCYALHCTRLHSPIYTHIPSPTHPRAPMTIPARIRLPNHPVLTVQTLPSANPNCVRDDDIDIGIWY